MLNLQPAGTIAHTPMAQWFIRPAVMFWAEAYTAGVRIVWDGQRFAYQQSRNWYWRMEQYQAFGVFPDTQPAEAEPWIAEGVEQHTVGLTVFLSQQFPKAYQRFAAHMLVLDHEVCPIEFHARRNGHIISSAGVNGGHVLMYRGKCAPATNSYTPTLPAILSQYGVIAI